MPNFINRQKIWQVNPVRDNPAQRDDGCLCPVRNRRRSLHLISNGIWQPWVTEFVKVDF
jgi:hypothetical protein